jgi:hypothetical protein
VPTGPETDGPVGDDGPRPTLRERLSGFFLKPPPPGSAPAEVAPPPSVEELEDANRYANDKERVIGLIAAPLAGLIAILIIGAQLSNNPPAQLANGKPNAAHVSPSLYHELLIVLLVLAVAMLASAWFRKRLYLGLATALYGLAVFNLHYWGFGIPFVLFGAWFLVRSYRAQKAVREATGDVRGGPGAGATGPRPRPSKRYTPPTSKPKRPAKGEDEQKAG